VLAVFGNTECSARQQRVRFWCSVGRKNSCVGDPNRFHNAGKKVKNANVEGRLLTRIMVAQEI